jgi:hypothetical protein
MNRKTGHLDLADPDCMRALHKDHSCSPAGCFDRPFRVRAGQLSLKHQYADAIAFWQSTEVTRSYEADLWTVQLSN